MTQMARLLSAWTAWALSRRFLVLGGVFALALASVVYTALKLDFQTSRLGLISPRHPLVTLTQRLKPFEQRDDFTVVVEAPTPHRAVAFVQEVARRLQEDPAHFQEVFFRVDPGLVRRWALLYLDAEGLVAIRDRLAEYPTLIQGLVQHPDLVHFFSLVNQEMASRMVGALFTDFLKEAPQEENAAPPQRMDLGFLIQTLDGVRSTLHGDPEYQSPWATFFQEASWDRELEGYFWVAEKRYLLFFVTPVREQGTFNQNRAALEHLRSVLQKARAAFADVQVGVTGQDALNADEMTVALRDISWATWISLAGAWLIIALFFRSQGRTCVRILSLSIGLCWTFGWTTLCIGHLNILSMVFAPMLIGLGVDYGIHWFARLEEEEQDPELSSQEVILRVAARSGPGILMAAVSAACAFLPLILTGFTGLAELGLISGVGILCSVLADLSVLPLLSLPAKRRQRAAQRPTTSDTADLLAFTRRGAAWALVGAGSLCLLSLWSGWRVGFDANPLHLQARGTESVAWAERLRQHATRSVIFAAIVADSAEEVAAKTAALEILPEVWKVQSVFTLLPAHQEDKIPLLRAALTDLDAMGRGPSASPPPDPGTLVQLLERIRFKVDEEQADRWGAQRPLIDQMRQVRALTAEILEALHRAAPGSVAALGAYQRQFQEDLGDVFDLLAQGATAPPMRLADLPTPLRDRFLLQGHYLIQIYPREDVWDWAPRDRFVQAIRHIDPQVMGAVVTLHVFTGAFLKASVQAALYALIALFGLLILTFRAWRLACLALIPLVVGTLWTVGSMGFIGLQFNVANTIFLPLIVGAGVEYGIIILYRWQEGRMQPGHLPLSTGKGVILATLTTTIGFGSLMLCRYRGTFSLGVLAFVGSLFVLAATLVLMPASMAFLTPPQLSLEKEERTI